MQQPQQTPQTPRVAYRYANFYNECADYPELPKFRRLGAQWAKKLYDDVEELLKEQEELNDALATFRRAEGRDVLTLLECPRISQDLCLSHQLLKLPDHSPYFSKRLKGFPNLFPNGDFGPTNEKGAAAAYQNLAARDFVAWSGVESVRMESADMLSTFYINHSDWIEKHVLRRLRDLRNCYRPSPHGTQVTRVRLSTIVRTIDMSTCIFVPLLLTATMFALVSVRPLKVRIALVGVFGLAFSFSSKLISGRISRGEIFAYTAAFFAVASVFVSTTDDDVAKTA